MRLRSPEHVYISTPAEEPRSRSEEPPGSEGDGMHGALVEGLTNEHLIENDTKGYSLFNTYIVTLWSTLAFDC